MHSLGRRNYSSGATILRSPILNPFMHSLPENNIHWRTLRHKICLGKHESPLQTIWMVVEEEHSNNKESNSVEQQETNSRHNSWPHDSFRLFSDRPKRASMLMRHPMTSNAFAIIACYSPVSTKQGSTTRKDHDEIRTALILVTTLIRGWQWFNMYRFWYYASDSFLKR